MSADNQPTTEQPKRWDPRKKALVSDDDWLLWDLRPRDKGAEVTGQRGRRRRR
jgi:hypothetical protein